MMESVSAETNTITIPINMNRQDFSSFALFDTFIHKRHLLAPLCFALIMSGFAAICFIFHDHAQQAGLLGTVLLVIGLGLPAVYLSGFLSTIRKQADRLHLNGSPLVYTLVFSQNGFRAFNTKEYMQYTWGSIQRAYLRKKYIYLYTDSERAYLLPLSHPCAAQVTQLLKEKLPPSVLRSRTEIIR